MAPLQPLLTPRSLRGGKRSPSTGASFRLPTERSASFHGRTGTSSSTHQMPRPKTHPDLLTGGTSSSPRPPPAGFLKLGSESEQQQQRRVPAKVLVHVNVMGSVGALQVMASTEWTVEQLVAAAVKQYIKEGRRPPLPSPDPSSSSLHFSQFCLDCLDRKEKLIGLGSRNFFLFPKQNSATASSSSSDGLPVSSQSSSSCSREVDKASKLSIPWLRFMDFLL